MTNLELRECEKVLEQEGFKPKLTPQWDALEWRKSPKDPIFYSTMIGDDDFKLEHVDRRGFTVIHTISELKEVLSK